MTAYSAQLPPCELIATTRLPLTKRPSRPGPTSSTTPTPSKPGVAGNVGQDAVPTLDDQQVGRIDRAEDHPHPDLAGPRLGVRDVADAASTSRRITELLEDGGFHAVPRFTAVGRLQPSGLTTSSDNGATWTIEAG